MFNRQIRFKKNENYFLDSEMLHIIFFIFQLRIFELFFNNSIFGFYYFTFSAFWTLILLFSLLVPYSELVGFFFHTSHFRLMRHIKFKKKIFIIVRKIVYLRAKNICLHHPHLLLLLWKHLLFQRSPIVLCYLNIFLDDIGFDPKTLRN